MSIQRRGDAWRARYRGPDGRERSRSFDRRADAARWLATQKALMARGDWLDPAASRVLFEDVAALWVSTLVQVKPKTAHQYRHLLTRWVLPTWGQVPLNKITTEGIQQWVCELITAGLGASGARQSLSVLSCVLDAAVRARRIHTNPARSVRLRKPRPAERVFLTHLEVDRLAEAAGSSGPFIRFLAYTGLRFGEATALRARDVDLIRRRLHVVRAFSDVGGYLVEDSPKAHQARPVPLQGPGIVG
jgi:integrase